MDQKAKKPKILIARSESDLAAWDRFDRSVGTFCDIESVSTLPSQLPTDALQIYADPKILEQSDYGQFPDEALTVVNFGDATDEIASKPTLYLEELTGPDLIRVLHSQLMPRKLPGVATILDKGGIVLGEKILGTEALGACTDRVITVIKRIEGFELSSRLPDLRQVLTGALYEAVSRNPESFADFQIGVTNKKIVVNVKFPWPKNAGGKEAFLLATQSLDLLWNQIYLCSDGLLISHHTQSSEMELTAWLTSEKRKQTGKTLLVKKIDNVVRQANLLNALEVFDYRPLADIRVNTPLKTKNLSSEPVTTVETPDELPQNITQKIEDLEEQSNKYKSEIESKNETIANLKNQNLHLVKELQARKNELLKEKRGLENQIESLKSLLQAGNKKQEPLNSVSTNPAKDLPSSHFFETINKLEASLKAQENEKNQINEKFNNEQKKVTLLETKYSNLYKEIGAKDKELNELKAMLVKARKDQSNHSAGVANGTNNSSNNGDSTKLKEAETREHALKSEVRKLAFKIENHEKNVKAIQQEASEKNKLLEQKLQAAKAKELELLKKIDDLSAALKKAAKAA